MRIDRFIAAHTPHSRKAVKAILKAHRVWVDGEPVTRPATHINPATAVVLLDREPVRYRERVVIVMHKPAGVVCATRDSLHETALDLVPGEFRHRELRLVGRLDIDTTGLLVVTDDGDLVHRLTHPRRHLAKVYEVTYAGTLDDQAIKDFEAGLTLADGTECLPALLELQAAGTARVTIKEGRYHQVKRMVAACGGRVTALHRSKVGGFALDPALEPGQARELTEAEVDLMLGG